MAVSDGGPSSAVVPDPRQSIVNFNFGITGGGSGNTASQPTAPTRYAPMDHMGSSATGAATTDGNGVVTLPNSGTYSVSLTGNGGASGTNTMSVALQDVDTDEILFSVTQTGDGTLNPPGSGTFAAPDGGGTFNVECVVQVSSSDFALVGILATFQKIS